MTFMLKTALHFLIYFFHYFLTNYKGYIFSDLRERIYPWIRISTLSCKSCGSFFGRRLAGHLITTSWELLKFIRFCWLVLCCIFRLAQLSWVTDRSMLASGLFVCFQTVRAQSVSLQKKCQNFPSLTLTSCISGQGFEDRMTLRSTLFLFFPHGHFLLHCFSFWETLFLCLCSFGGKKWGSQISLKWHWF